MKPTIVRWVASGRPAARMIWKSRPGAVNPVQLATIKWVIAVRLQRSDRLHGQVQRVRLIQCHAGGGRRKRPAAIEAGGVQDLVAWPGSSLEDRVTVVDVRKRRHAVEQSPPVRVCNRVAAELDEGGVDIMRRDGRADAIQPGLGHGHSLTVLPRCGGASALRQGAGGGPFCDALFSMIAPGSIDGPIAVSPDHRHPPAIRPRSPATSAKTASQSPGRGWR